MFSWWEDICYFTQAVKNGREKMSNKSLQSSADQLG